MLRYALQFLCRSVLYPADSGRAEKLRIFHPEQGAIRAGFAPLLVAGLLSIAGCAAGPGAGEASGHEARRERVVMAALNAQGAPYRYGGATPDGFDCSGLVQYAHGAAGLHVPRTARSQFAASTPVASGRMQPGDLLFFRDHDDKVTHVGIYVGNGKFVHAPSSGKRVATARLANPYWARRLVRGGRLW